MVKETLLPIQKELEQVQNILTDVFKIRAANLKDYIQLDSSFFNSFFRPALVILSAGLFNSPARQVIFLAAIVQFIHIAFQIHKDIIENEDQSIKNEDVRNCCQFPVLVGDYFYSRFFSCLCEANLLKYLYPLSELICQFSEGIIMRLENKIGLQVVPDPIYNTIIEKETALFIAGSCKLSGELGGGKGSDLKHLHHFGFNLGMYIGLIEDRASPDRTFPYLKEVFTHLQHLPPGVFRDSMEEMIGLLQKKNGFNG